MSERALVVEPDFEIARMLAALLRTQFTFESTRVDTLAQAIEAMKSDRFTAAVVDISRDATRLEELTHQTRKQDTAVVVLTTGRVDRETMKLFVSDHVYAVFPKPFDPDVMVTTIREALAYAKGSSPISSALHGFLKHTLHRDE